MSEKSLQINIDSIDDARAVIQNLASIKAAFDAHGCTSVELCIFEELITPTTPILMGAIPWTKTYRRTVGPTAGNILFQLPHFVQPAPVPAPSADEHEVPYTALETGIPAPVVPPKVNKRQATGKTFGKKPPASPAALVQPAPDEG